MGYNTFEVLSQYVPEEQLHEIYDDVLKQCAENVQKKYHG